MAQFPRNEEKRSMTLRDTRDPGWAVLVRTLEPYRQAKSKINFNKCSVIRTKNTCTPTPTINYFGLGFLTITDGIWHSTYVYNTWYWDHIYNYISSHVGQLFQACSVTITTKSSDLCSPPGAFPIFLLCPTVMEAPVKWPEHCFLPLGDQTNKPRDSTFFLRKPGANPHHGRQVCLTDSPDPPHPAANRLGN